MVFLASLPRFARGASPCDGIEIDPYRELAIVDPAVLEDARANPGGPWHITSLLKQMLPADATDADLSSFVVRWLTGSQTERKVNGFDLQFPGFALGERTICSWFREAGGGSACAADHLDPSRAPYRLVAIVNRVDLDGHNIDVAEGRFVFASLTAPTSNPVSDPAVTQQPETVIFEYALPLTGPGALKGWAQQWHALSDPSLRCTDHASCEPLRRALETLTAKFSSRGLVASKPNGNPLGQIRTSHIALGSSNIWSFRQFELQGAGKTAALVETPLSQTPNHTLDGTPAVSQAITAHAPEILKETFVLPREWLGGEALLDDGKDRQWTLDGVDENVRLAFSKQTCNGCHGENRNVDGFFHISPTSSGRDRVSDFLKVEEFPKRMARMKQILCPAR